MTNSNEQLPPWESVEPISDEELSALKKSAIRRWEQKPHYDGHGYLGSPGFHMRTHEVLALLSRIEKQEQVKSVFIGYYYDRSSNFNSGPIIACVDEQSIKDWAKKQDDEWSSTDYERFDIGVEY